MDDVLLHLADKYEPLEKLGEGGMGTVYKVRHRLLGEIRVVKMMRSALRDDEDLAARFWNEAKAAIQLRHPHIAQLFDFTVDEEGNAFILMEYIAGMTLEELLQTNTPPLTLSLEIAMQALKALGYLHRKNYVHRDISPDNLMLTLDMDGRPIVKLIDLGIAKSVEEDAPPLTATGYFLGKVRYSSPEQLGGTGAKIDGRSDLYSFGVVLYELLTGYYPIRGHSGPSWIAGHLYRPPRDFEESDPNESVPSALRDLLLETLAKDPEERPASAEVFSYRLSQIQSAFPIREAMQWQTSEWIRSRIEGRTSFTNASSIEDNGQRYTSIAPWKSATGSTEASQPHSELASATPDGRGTIEHEARQLSPDTGSSEVPTGVKNLRTDPSWTRRLTQTDQNLDAAGPLSGPEGQAFRDAPTALQLWQQLEPSSQEAQVAEESVEARLRGLPLEIDASAAADRQTSSSKKHVLKPARNLTAWARPRGDSGPSRQRTWQQGEARKTHQRSRPTDEIEASSSVEEKTQGLRLGETILAAPRERGVWAPRDELGKGTCSALRRALRHRRSAVVGAAFLLGLIGMAVSLWLWPSHERLEVPGKASPAIEARRPPPPPPSNATGLLVINASPWARLGDVIDHEGNHHSEGVGAYTPIAIDLPPGRYTLHLEHDDFEGFKELDIEVRPDETTRCLVQFNQVSVDAFFKKLGW